MTNKEIEIIYQAFLAITQNAEVLEELEILTDEDWDNIDQASAILKPLMWQNFL